MNTALRAALLGGHFGDTQELKSKLEKIIDRMAGDVVELTANTTLTEADSGKIYLIGTDSLTITLPSTAIGVNYTFINSGATTHNIITISPAAADGISGTITLAATVVVDAGVVGKDLINTKATSQCGDSVKLIGTGVPGTSAWIIAHSTGIWAAQG
ncbi:MAG TPA: hypothetical protein PLB28_07455 [Bacteroidales bacterium]|nr:hypothetical protein [Bacteroidales bacterium]